MKKENHLLTNRAGKWISKNVDLIFSVMSRGRRDHMEDDRAIQRAVIQMCSYNASMINVFDESGSRTLLMKAAEMGREALVTFLIEKGADITITNLRGENVLHIAYKDSTCVDELHSILLAVYHSRPENSIMAMAYEENYRMCIGAKTGARYGSKTPILYGLANESVGNHMVIMISSQLGGMPLGDGALTQTRPLITQTFNVNTPNEIISNAGVALVYLVGGNAALTAGQALCMKYYDNANGRVIHAGSTALRALTHILPDSTTTRGILTMAYMIFDFTCDIRLCYTSPPIQESEKQPSQGIRIDTIENKHSKFIHNRRWACMSRKTNAQPRSTIEPAMCTKNCQVCNPIGILGWSQPARSLLKTVLFCWEALHFRRNSAETRNQMEAFRKTRASLGKDELQLVTLGNMPLVIMRLILQHAFVKPNVAPLVHPDIYETKFTQRKPKQEPAWWNRNRNTLLTFVPMNPPKDGEDSQNNFLPKVPFHDALTDPPSLSPNLLPFVAQQH